MNHKERISAFVTEIWKWYASHKRILPWRDLIIADATERAYRILVSEIMLQQTQVPRVSVTYRNFLEKFPTINDLADASNKEVLMAWRGMGYNSRALRLKDAAKMIVEGRGRGGVGVRGRELINDLNPNPNPNPSPNPGFPTSMEDLRSIPGIGHYTAAAIRNFAFGIPTPCIDTNIRRILHRTFVGPENPDGTWEKDDEYLLGIADEVLKEAVSQGNRGNRSNRGNRGSSVTSDSSVASVSSEWHAALMDFGSLIQTKRNPKWEICPLTREGIMKTTEKSFGLRVSSYEHLATRNPQPATSSAKREPGRTVGSTFIPNRIFRGRVIESLRDAPRGLTLSDIGKQIAIDWDPKEHQEWLRGILKKLTQETMLGIKKGKYVLG